MKKVTLLIALCFAAIYSYGTACTPTFANACSSYPFNASIANLVGVSGSISDATSCTGASYENRTSLSVTLAAGGTYTATLGITPSYYSSYAVQVWIDFNNNGTFESTESVGGGGGFSSASPTISLSIPSSVSAGTVIMRIVGNYQCCGSGAYPSINPCPTTSVSYGDARDYTVIIGSGTLAVPSAVSAGEVQVYPNPANDELTIKAGATAGADFTISNSIGSVVMHQAISTNETKLNVKSLTPGVYNIKISGEGGTVVKQFVKL